MRWWTPLEGSVGFLTILPLPRHALTPADWSRALALFPLVGAILGGALGGLGLLLDRALPPGPVAALLLITGVVATGGLHLDGLIDTADAFGGQTLDQRLAIMRDSRVGAFGVITAVLALLAQFACLSALAGVPRLTALVLAYTASRWTMLAALWTFPAARPSGLGATLHAAATRASGLVGTGLAIAVALLFGTIGFAALAAAVVIVLGGGRLLARRLGGLTGDAYGALAVITETAVLFIAVASPAR